MINAGEKKSENNSTLQIYFNMHGIVFEDDIADENIPRGVLEVILNDRSGSVHHRYPNFQGSEEDYKKLSELATELRRDAKAWGFNGFELNYMIKDMQSRKFDYFRIKMRDIFVFDLKPKHVKKDSRYYAGKS